MAYRFGVVINLLSRKQELELVTFEHLIINGQCVSQIRNLIFYPKSIWYYYVASFDYQVFSVAFLWTVLYILPPCWVIFQINEYWL